MPLFGAAFAAPNKGTTISYWFKSLTTVLNTTGNRRIQGTFKAFEWFSSTFQDIYLNAKVSQLLLNCYSLLFEPHILLHDIVINKSNDLPFLQHENQISETYDCRSSTRNVRQPKFEKSQSYNTLHFIESQCYTTLHFIRKMCLTVICFQKQKGRQIKAGYFKHSVTFITST